MAAADTSSYASRWPGSLSMVGVHESGVTSVSAFITDGRTKPVIGHLLQLPIFSRPGEVFVGSGFVGPFVYVQDGANNRIYRYYDADLPETGDTTIYQAPHTLTSGSPFELRGRNLHTIGSVQIVLRVVLTSGTAATSFHELTVSKQTSESLQLIAPKVTLPGEAKIRIRQGPSDAISHGQPISVPILPTKPTDPASGDARGPGETAKFRFLAGTRMKAA